MRERIYVCHTYYHVYVACLKELNLNPEERGKAELVLSTMSNDFGDLQVRARACGLFSAVWMFEEKEDLFFPQLDHLRKNKGNLFFNMISRIRYTKLLGKLQQPYVPVDFARYRDIYVFCDSDPIGYYLSWRRIPYHALEDGLDCISTYDTARYDNRGNFKLKAFMAARNLIFIQNGWGKYCLDMEVNNISVLPYPCPKYKELRRETLVQSLGEEEKELLVRLFIRDMEGIARKLEQGKNAKKVLILTEPLCALDVRKTLFSDVIRQYGTGEDQDAIIMIKPHPRDLLDYENLFPDSIVLDGKFPMEVLNFIKGLRFSRVVSVFTVPDSIRFADEIVFLGEDFMDQYEPPEMHRQNEQIY